MDLLSQFARRRDDQRTDAALFASHQPLEDWQYKGSSFACTSLG
jgi:hypothetical protein